MSGDLIAAVDIGTTKISVVAASVTRKGLKVTGSGTASSKGIKKGVVTSINDAAASIKAAVAEAEMSAGTKIRSALFGISGHHVTGVTSSGIAGICRGRVSLRDKLLALRSAETVYIPLDRELLHAIPTEFIIDGQGGISDPLGMSGVRLESRLHMITADSRALNDIKAASEIAGVKVSDMVFGPMASAEAVLTSEEAEAGAFIMDIGGGTTDIAYVRDGLVRDVSVLGMGGLHITNDLAVGLRMGIADAEKIKTTEGAVVLNVNEGNEYIEMDLSAGDIRVRRDLVSGIIRCRCEELFELAGRHMRGHGGNGSMGSLIITGGTALLPGIASLASEVLNMPARVGLPNGVSGLGSGLKCPAYSSVIGLALYSARELEQQEEVLYIPSSCPGIVERFGAGLRRMINYKDFLGILNRKKKGVSYV